MKFRTHEIVEVARNEHFPACPLLVGDEVEIIATGPLDAVEWGTFQKTTGDYAVRDARGRVWIADEHELRRRRQPQPQWESIEAATGWSPQRAIA